MQKLHVNFGFEPTPGQERLLYAFTRFIYSDKPRCSLLVRGYAGTGKTTCVSAMVRSLEESGIGVLLLAPTGRAAKVLGNYSGRKAWTIHREIYSRRADRSGKGWFELRENQHRRTVFFVDEASMIGRGNSNPDATGFNDLLEDLISYVYSDDSCSLVLIGDGAQLPPVGSDKSPALNLDLLQKEFSLNIAAVDLTEVIRQKADSGILANATAVRNLVISGDATLPQFSTEGYHDVIRVDSDLQSYFEEAYSRYGKDDMIIITRSNKRANLFNQQVRARVLWHEEEINAGDRMMVLKNNYFWLSQYSSEAGFIANGDTIQIQRVLRYEDREGFRFCKAIVKLVDFPDEAEFETILLCNTINDDHPSLSQEKMAELGNLIALDYPDITQRAALRKKVFSDPYYNALQVKFAYAITCHKAQGGQWPCVFVDQGYLTDEMAGIELSRWFYTAVTRASEVLYLVGFSEKMYS
ncbi:MAG: AAA family ATPase [Flavobacteriales bacterium]|nr:AAA family ATPase [Flavobacteriales bacterium]